MAQRSGGFSPADLAQLLAWVNQSGFPFQTALEALIRQTATEWRWSVTRVRKAVAFRGASVMSADKLIDRLKTIHGVKSVTIEDICTPHICVVTDSPAVAEYIDGLRVLNGLQGKQAGFVVYIELE